MITLYGIMCYKNNMLGHVIKVRCPFWVWFLSWFLALVLSGSISLSPSPQTCSLGIYTFMNMFKITELHMLMWSCFLRMYIVKKRFINKLGVEGEGVKLCPWCWQPTPTTRKSAVWNRCFLDCLQLSLTISPGFGICTCIGGQKHSFD